MLFLTSKLIGVLKKDHDTLRECYKVLKNEDAEMAEIKRAFLKLVPALEAHSKSEEEVVYSFMLSEPELSPMALEGQVEHNEAEQLMVALDAEFLDYDEKWKAKAKVLAELLEHHISEEESDTFPKLKRHLTVELDEELAQKYEQANVSHREMFFQRQKAHTPTDLYPRTY